MTRAGSFNMQFLALDMNKPGGLYKQNLFWLCCILYAVLLPAVLALSVSFMIGPKDDVPSPTVLINTVDGFRDCGYLAEDCSADQIVPTLQPSVAPTPFPTKSPTAPTV